ncbi:MAG: hypothetical protein A2X46_08660 [Lentisphaerae bacterium GWF2_57_35]|nr:MAG: hypothetical protein A2X46_08660 [Lentisphaerae bacterium GWF2_57_35]
MADSQQDTALHFLDYWRVIKSRKEIVMAVTLLIVITGVAVTFMQPKKYSSTVRILVREDSMDVDVFERQMIQGYNPFFLRTQERILKSTPLLYAVIDNLNLQAVWGQQYNDDKSPITKEDALATLSSSIKIEQDRDTSLINISVTQEDRELAARIANEMAAVYREQRLDVKRSELRRAIEVLDNEVQKQQEKVDQAESELERIRQEVGVSFLGQGFRADKVRLQQLEADRIASRVDMLVRKARLNQLESLEGTELMNASSYVVMDQSIASIRQQLIDTEVALKLMLENMGVNHPDVKRLQAGVDELKKKLNESLVGLKIGLNADYEVAKAKFDALEAELQAAKHSDIEDEKKKFLPFDRAERNVIIQRDILNALRARITQQGIEVEVPRTPVEVVEPAEPANKPSSPLVMLNILLSIFLGFGAGIGLAYFIEYLDTSVRTVDDVEQFLGLPVLGVIPQKIRPLIHEGPESPHGEPYRVLRTNMQFSNKGIHGGAFAVISGGVGEGKSTTLFNLAYTCAQLGYKTIVVDSDLRRPVQHSILSMSNRIGLTNVLMKDSTLEECVKPTIVPNLSFLPSGRLPRSMMGIIDSQRMRELVKDLKSRYDYVFFDSPPIIGITDASILASEVDGVLLVVQYRKYPRVISSRAKRMVENVGGKLLGVVLNNINIMRDDYYYYYHASYTQYNPDGQEKVPAKTIAASADGKDSLF